MKKSIKTIAVAASLIVTIHASGNVCYNQDGSATSSTTFKPCDPSADVTHCCDGDQTCLSNGLCLVKWDTSINTGLCTDSSWSSPACFQSCLSSNRIPSLSTLYRCQDNNWCCSTGGNVTSCCGDANVDLFRISSYAYIQNSSALESGIALVPAEAVESPTPVTITTELSGTVITITATPTAGATCVGSSTSGSSTSSSSSDNKALTAGLGAGLGVGIPLVAIIGVLSYMLFREKRRHSATGPLLHSLVHKGDKMEASPPYTDGAYRNESRGIPVEAGGQETVRGPGAELP